MQLYPAILTESMATFQAQLDLVRLHPQLTTVHVDVIDGYFADNVTLTPLDLIELNLEGIDLIFHLMVNEPLDFVYEAVSIKDRLPIKGIVAQIERMTQQREYIQEVKRHDWQVGLALDLHTPLESIDDESWDQLDILQLMSIEAGFQGRAFSPQVFTKIIEARQHLQQINHSLELVLDGGIKLEMLEQIRPTNIESIVVGSGLWATPDPTETIQSFLDNLE